MSYFGLVCARGGSKGILNKNIINFNGKPLIYWAIKCGLSVKDITKVLVSSDSSKIINLSKKYGAEVPFIRPKYLSTDNSPEWKSWQHALKYINTNYNKKIKGLIIIPTTAPLRKTIDIKKAIKIFEDNNSDVVISVRDAERNPYFNMVEYDSNKNLIISKKSKKNIFRRQDAPEVFDMTTVVFIIRPSFLEKKNNIFEGKINFVKIPYHRSIDIDNRTDLFMANSFLKYKDN
jgi:CMP-N-acetylneuraminic acid synthetase